MLEAWIVCFSEGLEEGVGGLERFKVDIDGDVDIFWKRRRSLVVSM